jgi:hypothetical protein
MSIALNVPSTLLAPANVALKVSLPAVPVRASTPAVSDQVYTKIISLNINDISNDTVDIIQDTYCMPTK